VRADGGPIQVARLHGTPFERGLAHGRALGSLIDRYWKDLLREVADNAVEVMTESELLGWVHEAAAPAIALSPDLDEEVRGIGEGSGLGYEVALCVNLFEEISALAWNRGRTVARARGLRCSAVMVPPPMTTTGTWLLAQNWDGADWWDDPILFVVGEESGASAYLTDAGSVGGIGVNDRGVASAHTGVGLRENVPGLPYSFIARRILQAGDASEAARTVIDGPSTAGCHYVVVSGERAIDVEAAGARNSSSVRAGTFATCAHFEDPECVGAQSKDIDGSVFRVGRIEERVRAEAPVGVEELFGIMGDHQPGPQGITVCRHPDETFDTRTSGCAVMSPDGRMWARAGNPCEARPTVEIAV
jgi:isopenicillin-N N-acyltransferase-like protein